MFAKLYNDTEYGQILIKMDTNDDGEPEIRLYFEPEGFGVCSLAMEYADEPGANKWDKVEHAFNKLDQEDATKIVGGAIERINNSF